MTLGNNFFTEKGETIKHYLIKMIIYKLLRNEAHEVYVECQVGEGIADVFDKTTGIVYEVQNTMGKALIQEKFQKYMKSVSCNDVKIIPLAIFPDLKMPNLIKLLGEFIV